jgi:hypothetical protein
MWCRVVPFVLAALVLSTDIGAGADAPLKAVDARDHVGKRVTVCGKVVEVQKAIYKAGRSWVLNLDAPAPRPPLSLYVPGNAIDNYFWNADKKYANQQVCASGFIRDREGLIYMQILQPSDLKIVKNEDEPSKQ